MDIVSICPLNSCLPPCRLVPLWDSIPKVFLYIGWWLTQKLTADQSAESKGWGCSTQDEVSVYFRVYGPLKERKERVCKYQRSGKTKMKWYLLNIKDGNTYKLLAAVVTCVRLVQYHASQHCSTEGEGFTSPYHYPRSYGQLMSYGKKKVIFSFRGLSLISHLAPVDDPITRNIQPAQIGASYCF